jgi:hypothetical protein
MRRRAVIAAVLLGAMLSTTAWAQQRHPAPRLSILAFSACPSQDPNDTLMKRQSIANNKVVSVGFRPCFAIPQPRCVRINTFLAVSYQRDHLALRLGVPLDVPLRRPWCLRCLQVSRQGLSSETLLRPGRCSARW